MSLKSAKEFLEKISIDKEFLKSVNALKNEEQRNIFLKENGFDFTKEEYKELTSELSNSDLESVSGGLRGNY